MEPLRTKPVYHRPIPWQVVTALALIGGYLVLLTVRAASLWAAYTLLGPRAELAPEVGVAQRWALLALIVTALAIVLNVVLGVCIAARQNWARVLAHLLYLIFAVFHICRAVFFGAMGTAAWPLYGGIAFCLALLYLLHGEEAKAYTYKGGGGSWPEE